MDNAQKYTYIGSTLKLSLGVKKRVLAKKDFVQPMNLAQTIEYDDVKHMDDRASDPSAVGRFNFKSLPGPTAYFKEAARIDALSTQVLKSVTIWLKQPSNVEKIFRLLGFFDEDCVELYTKLMYIIAKGPELQKLKDRGDELYTIFEPRLRQIIEFLPVEYYNDEFKEALLQVLCDSLGDLESLSDEKIKRAFYKCAVKIKLKDDAELREIKKQLRPKGGLSLRQIAYKHHYEGKRIHKLNRNEIAASYGWQGPDSGNKLSEHFRGLETSDQRILSRKAADNILQVIPTLTNTDRVKAEQEYKLAEANKQ